jgi:squalene-hopene/tetraprenyl-beta-curcumene cyclase
MTKYFLLAIALHSLLWASPQQVMAQDAPSTPLRSQYHHDELRIAGAYANEPRRDEFSAPLALAYLENGVKAWIGQKGCVSCHTPGSYMFTRPAMTSHFGKPSEEVHKFFLEELASLRELPRSEFQEGTTSAEVVYIATGLAEWDTHVRGELSSETDQALRFMFEVQQTNGAWHSLDCWPPFESSTYQEATMAIMAAATAPGWLTNKASADDELNQRVQKTMKFLQTTQPPHDYARVLLLWASARTKGLLSTDRRENLIQLIRSKQHSDGGWAMRDFAQPEEWGSGNRAEKLKSESTFATPPSDGHMTGLCALVLQETGSKSDDVILQNALRWLATNQRQSGRWWTRSLNTDKFHFITYSGTCYPLLALANSGAIKPCYTSASTPDDQEK